MKNKCELNFRILLCVYIFIENYRGIAILTTIAKAFESLICDD